MIGIMQGRLLPPYGDRLQAFPVDRWRDELDLVHQAGLECIEWVYEFDNIASNPLATREGVFDVVAAVRQTGVRISSVCADYFMREQLVSVNGVVQEAAVCHLNDLLERVAPLRPRYMVLPFVDGSSLTTPAQVDGARRAIAAALGAVDATQIELHLETDMNAADLVSLLEAIDHPRIRANYDTGNSAALGHAPQKELPRLSSWLGSVHIKDRELGGGSVPLDTGAADLRSSLCLIQQAGFIGPYILQTAREPGVSEVELARRNRHFVEQLLAETAA